MESIKYFTIKDYQTWNSLDSELTEMERCEIFMSYHKNKSIDEIRETNKNTLMKEYAELVNIFESTSAPSFYPIIEIDGVLHGFVDISQMTLGEYVDLEKLAKHTDKNLSQMMAILYRPIKSHKFKNLKFNIVNTYNTFRDKITNIWEYYTLEPYTYANSVVVTERMDKFPISFALGAVSFFLLQISLISQSSALYSTMTPQQRKKTNWMKQMKNLIPQNTLDIGDGLLQFVISRRHPSLTLQGISVSQI